MDKQFWHQRWESNRIGFHNYSVNPALETHYTALKLPGQSSVFLPLCGKTLDIKWLLDKGHRVVGVELSECAITQLFDELGVEPHIAEFGEFKHYTATNLDIFVGDIFDLNAEMLDVIDAVYDRAALVALPDTMRKRYTAHLVDITNAAPQLLVTFEYDQQLMEGPPFSVSSEEVNVHYEDIYTLRLLENHDIEGGLKGVCPAQKHVWYIAKQ